MPNIHNFVTNAEWNLYKPEHTFPFGEDNKPVFGINHIEAMQYAAWLSKKTGRRFRLPTEEDLKEAEATFEADFSKHPLPEVPDVGTFGKNKDGVADLLGVGYAWCANSEDVSWSRSQWGASDPTPTPTPSSPTRPNPADDSLSAIRIRLTAEADEARARLAKLEGALKAIDTLVNL